MTTEYSKQCIIEQSDLQVKYIKRMLSNDVVVYWAVQYKNYWTSELVNSKVIDQLSVKRDLSLIVLSLNVKREEVSSLRNL